MALKDIFTMVKADRYTQDGREQIIKALKAETEDARRTYQIGEISETTGLQKTATGWKPPKNGATQKKSVENQKIASSLNKAKFAVVEKLRKEGLSDPQILEHEEYKKADKALSDFMDKATSEKSGSQLNKNWTKEDVITSMPEGWKRVEGATTAPNGYVVVSNNKSRFGGERQTKLIKQEDFEKSTASSKPQNEEGNPALEASSKELDSLYKKSGVDEFVKTSMSEVRSGKKSLDQHWIDLEKFKKASPFYEQIKSEEKKNHKLRGWKTESTDSAPRVLTGDCKVRVKK